MVSVQRRGRPRKDGERFPGGDLKPKSEAEREKQRREEERQRKLAEERRMAEDKRLIHAQPHRRDDPEDSRRESPLGRFVAANKLKTDIHLGVDKFGDLVRRWRSLNDVPSDVRVPRTGVGGGDPPSDEEIRNLGKRIVGIQKRVVSELMKVCGKSDAGAAEIYETVRAMAVDGRDIMILSPQPIVIALSVIAVEMGTMGRGLKAFDSQAA